jgi:hypothetical protein
MNIPNKVWIIYNPLVEIPAPLYERGENCS